jgi:hypothetical protein
LSPNKVKFLRDELGHYAGSKSLLPKEAGSNLLHHYEEMLKSRDIAQNFEPIKETVELLKKTTFKIHPDAMLKAEKHKSLFEYLHKNYKQDLIEYFGHTKVEKTPSILILNDGDMCYSYTNKQIQIGVDLINDFDKVMGRTKHQLKREFFQRMLRHEAAHHVLDHDKSLQLKLADKYEQIIKSFINKDIEFNLYQKSIKGKIIAIASSGDNDLEHVSNIPDSLIIKSEDLRNTITFNLFHHDKIISIGDRSQYCHHAYNATENLSKITNLSISPELEFDIFNEKNIKDRNLYAISSPHELYAVMIERGHKL